jgi:hypothetical protein
MYAWLDSQREGNHPEAAGKLGFASALRLHDFYRE